MEQIVKQVTEEQEILREKQLTEAIARLEQLDLMDPVLQSFKESQRIFRSEFAGILFWLNDEEMKMVRRFEQKWDGLVYHVILSHTTFGTMYSLFYVSKYEEEWEHDREDLRNGEALVYVHNVTDEILSELGYIGFRPLNGGLIRTY